MLAKRRKVTWALLVAVVVVACDGLLMDPACSKPRYCPGGQVPGSDPGFFLTVFTVTEGPGSDFGGTTVYWVDVTWSERTGAGSIIPFRANDRYKFIVPVGEARVDLKAVPSWCEVRSENPQWVVGEKRGEELELTFRIYCAEAEAA